jgi:hypothetical protein
MNGKIKVGDRVKATGKETGDTAEFTVTHVAPGYLESRNNTYVSLVFDFEILAPALPAKKGIYLYYSYGLDKDGDLSQFPNLVLHLSADPESDWVIIGNTPETPRRVMPLSEVRERFSTFAPLTLKGAA